MESEAIFHACSGVMFIRSSITIMPTLTPLAHIGYVLLRENIPNKPRVTSQDTVVGVNRPETGVQRSGYQFGRHHLTAPTFTTTPRVLSAGLSYPFLQPPVTSGFHNATPRITNYPALHRRVPEPTKPRTCVD
ncbi:hypothetical protein evm_000165 [Chilo suppressalis]|nr:hypothetical protein evm_000165 [Chilo suppressalis]